MEDLETRRRRLKFRANHRGTKELDIILGGFANANLMQFDAEQLDAFETLLNEEEVHLQSWLMGLSEVPQNVDAQLLAKISADHEGRVSAEKAAHIEAMRKD